MMSLREHTVCFTGHRKIPPEQQEKAVRQLRKTIFELAGNGYRYFGAGGALGFDTLAAQTILNLKSALPQIRLILVLPCLSQSDRWSMRDKEIYEAIKARADKIVYTSREYTRGCMQKRNRHLVDNSSVCVCYLKETTGGTAYTVEYARSKNLRIINTAE